jgi:hypothetical protein
MKGEGLLNGEPRASVLSQTKGFNLSSISFHSQNSFACKVLEVWAEGKLLLEGKIVENGRGLEMFFGS